jgi:REP element-mobilizing transposase RayT
MVIAYHLIWTAYGWWLPNDPRGSGSKHVNSARLLDLGKLHQGRKQIQPSGRVVREFYEKAAPLLKHPLLTFDEPARTALASAFEEEIARQNYTCWACAVMPDHVHILIRKHKHLAEEMAENLMRASREKLTTLGHRESSHPTWIDATGWKVYLDPDDILRTIRYVELNPVKIGLPEQKWCFVKAYDGWPFHKRK